MSPELKRLIRAVTDSSYQGGLPAGLSPQEHPTRTFCQRMNLALKSLIGASVLLAMSGCYNMVPNLIKGDPTTETWRCFKWEDYADARVWGRNPRGNGIIQASRSLEGNKESASGTVTIGGVTFPAEFKLIGVNRAWYYQSQGNDAIFAILPSGQSASATRGLDGEMNFADTRLNCVSD